MKVKDLMTAEPKTCGLSDTLAEAAGFMWEKDCGILPVLDQDEKVVGLLTDRDICMAAALKARPLADIGVEETITRQVFACEPNDDIRTALDTMQKNRVRRLPVVASDGTLHGILSMNDVVLKAEPSKEKKGPDLSYADVVNAYKSICEHRVPKRQAQAAGN